MHSFRDVLSLCSFRFRLLSPPRPRQASFVACLCSSHHHPLPPTNNHHPPPATTSPTHHLPHHHPSLYVYVIPHLPIMNGYHIIHKRRNIGQTKLFYKCFFFYGKGRSKYPWWLMFLNPKLLWWWLCKSWIKDENIISLINFYL